MISFLLDTFPQRHLQVEYAVYNENQGASQSTIAIDRKLSTSLMLANFLGKGK